MLQHRSWILSKTDTKGLKQIWTISLYWKALGIRNTGKQYWTRPDLDCILYLHPAWLLYPHPAWTEWAFWQRNEHEVVECAHLAPVQLDTVFMKTHTQHVLVQQPCWVLALQYLLYHINPTEKTHDTFSVVSVIVLCDYMKTLKMVLEHHSKLKRGGRTKQVYDASQFSLEISSQYRKANDLRNFKKNLFLTLWSPVTEM